MIKKYDWKEDESMKVFISWSGQRSKKVASIFRDWLPSVIQSIEPFVSSEDIEKGSRWNTDIAQELKESTFGIICVTKDNLSAPWLNFEAGALSKTIENSYVAPFLFDVKPSELKDSPISQFQATSFTKDDLKRLLETLNKATGNSLTDQMLLRAFDVWYPGLEKSLQELGRETYDVEEAPAPVAPDVLEELLETTRNTQRLLGNTDNKLHSNIEQLQKTLEEVIFRNEKMLDINKRKHFEKNSIFSENLIYMLRPSEFDGIFPYNFLIVLSLYKDDFPWLYDAGSEMVKVMQSKSSKATKQKSLESFRRILEFTSEHPLMREAFRFNKDSRMLLRELEMRTLDMFNFYIEDLEH